MLLLDLPLHNPTIQLYLNKHGSKIRKLEIDNKHEVSTPTVQDSHSLEEFLRKTGDQLNDLYEDSLELYDSQSQVMNLDGNTEDKAIVECFKRLLLHQCLNLEKLVLRLLPARLTGDPAGFLSAEERFSLLNREEAATNITSLTIEHKRGTPNVGVPFLQDLLLLCPKLTKVRLVDGSNNESFDYTMLLLLKKHIRQLEFLQLNVALSRHWEILAFVALKEMKLKYLVVNQGLCNDSFLNIFLQRISSALVGFTITQPLHRAEGGVSLQIPGIYSKLQTLSLNLGYNEPRVLNMVS